MAKVEVQMRVWKRGDDHYCTIGMAPVATPPGAESVFVVTEKGDLPGVTNKLRESARAEARRRNIDHVVNLDD